ncbi:hypothetical protein Tco_0441571 [Tanacetum coccineum]
MVSEEVKQQPDGIFISQDKYVADTLKKFDFWSIRTSTTPTESNKPLVKDEDGEDVDKLSQTLTMEEPALTENQQQVAINFLLLIVVGKSYGTISVIKNLVAHSRTKHIEIRFHFIRDCYEKRRIEVVKIHINHNVADLLTKGFDVTRFNFLIVSIGMLNL